jgi:DNA-binding GntR family transcriptional regulator
VPAIGTTGRDRQNGRPEALPVISKEGRMVKTKNSPSTKKKRLLREHVYKSIKNAVISGDLEPNRRLIEEKLAEEMETSRTPVREAIQKLEKEGLIYRLPRGGFAVKGITEDELEEVFGLRSVLEGYAGYLATTRILPDEFKTLDQIVSEEEECLKKMNADDFIRLDGEFHDVLYRAAKNVRLYTLLNDLRDYMYRYRIIILRYQRKHHLAVEDHKNLLSWLKAKNGKQVEKLLRKHMIRGKDIIKRKIRQGQEPRP